MSLDVALSALLIFGAACYLTMGARLLSMKQETGSMPIGVLFVVISIWTVGGGIELLAENFAVFSIGRTGHFIGTAMMPVVAYVCFREYTGFDTSSRKLLLLSIIPLVSVVLAATNSLHEFMWYLPASNDAGEYLTRPRRWGPWFLFIHLPYNYAVIGASAMTLLTHNSAIAPAHRRGLFLLTAACALPILATIFYDLGFGPDTLSFVPLVFSAMLPAFAWLIFGERIVEFAPLAYETVFQNMQDPVVVIDDERRIISLNRGAERMLSVDEPEARRKPLNALFGPDAKEVFDVLETGRPHKMMTSTGRFLHVQVSPVDINRSSGRGGKVLMFRDVSDVEQAQLEVRKNEKMLNTIINHSVNGIIRFRWESGADGRPELRSIFANAAAARFLEIPVEELVQRAAPELIGLATSGMESNAASDVVERFEQTVIRGASLEVEVKQRKRGVDRWLSMICEPMGADIAMTLVDITDSKAKEQLMESIATSDPLTQVLNRRGFERDATLRLSESDDSASGALMFIDLNDFKKINDHCGHEIGDQLLRIAAERLQGTLRSCDIIGRPGGDEFVALVPDVDADRAHSLAVRLTRSLGEPYLIGDKKLVCTASIGLALYPDNATTLTGLLREADQAMYRAKARCRGVVDIRGNDLLEKAM